MSDDTIGGLVPKSELDAARAELAAANALIERMSQGAILQDALKERDALRAAAENAVNFLTILVRRKETDDGR